MLKLKLQYFGHLMNWLIWKDPDAGKDWRQEEKRMTEDEMVGWHHRLNGHRFGWTPGVGDGQGGLACCSSWGCRKSNTTERLNWTSQVFFTGKFWFYLEQSWLSCFIIYLFYLTSLLYLYYFHTSISFLYFGLMAFNTISWIAVHVVVCVWGGSIQVSVSRWKHIVSFKQHY